MQETTARIWASGRKLSAAAGRKPKTKLPAMRVAASADAAINHRFINRSFRKDVGLSASS